MTHVKPKRQRRDINLIIRVSRSERLALNQAAALQDVPASWLARKAINRAVQEAAAK